MLSEVRPTKLFLGGISQNTTTKDLRTHFSQYGRVLDCVAMRHEDGRSRSFGYVTLDSLEAAKKCIVTAQKVDGRVIDVKLAVPERTSKEKTPPNSLNSTKGKRRQATKDVAEEEIITTDCSSFVIIEDQEDVLSGNTDSDSASDSGDGYEGEAEDGISQRLLSIGAPPGLSLPLTGLPTTRPPPPGFAARPPPPGFAPPPPPCAIAALLSKAAAEDASDETSTAAPSSNSTPDTVFVNCADESDGDESEEQVLPSLGSALHAAGQCRPCNFFGKGRCENGKACEFCHVPHQKRKPTRQEKRDRKLAWMERQTHKTKGCANAVIDDAAEIGEEVDFEPLESLASVAVPLYTPQQLSLQACMINFDDYSDFSDSDDDSVAVAKPATVYKEPAMQWSREEMLHVKVALAAA